MNEEQMVDSLAETIKNDIDSSIIENVIKSANKLDETQTNEDPYKRKLKECPSCETTNQVILKRKFDRVQCNYCGTTGPWYDNHPFDAIADWNSLPRPSKFDKWLRDTLLVDKFGWPIVRVKGKYMQNCLRILLQNIRKLIS